VIVECDDPLVTASASLAARLERAVVVALGAAPPRLQSLIAGPLPTADGTALEPEVGAALRLLNALPDTDFTQLPLDEARAQIDHEAVIFGGPPLPMHDVREVSIPIDAGHIAGRRYRARPEDADRLLVYFHGGGWVVGGLDSADSVCRFIARHAGVTVLSVDYRLAPEHPFPAAPDDARAAFAYAQDRADDWGHDPSLIAVGGDSAGANLATVLCHDLRDQGRAVPQHSGQPAFQLLFFPATDLSTRHPSYQHFAEGFFLTTKQMDWYTRHYLAGHPASDPRVSPLLADDLADLPPAYVAVAGFDVLRDEGEAYARAMSAAGVHVALRRHERLIHAFVNSTGVGRSSREAVLEACGALRAGVAAGTRRVPAAGSLRPSAAEHAQRAGS
jgi:acetyl esterase